MKHPQHISGRLRDASERFAGHADDYHLFYNVICACGHDSFSVFRSAKPALKVICARCATEVIVYDASYYPAASRNKASEKFDRVPGGHESERFQVYAMYEYGQLDDGEEFDPDDITWCQVFIENDRRQLVMILDDETA